MSSSNNRYNLAAVGSAVLSTGWVVAWAAGLLIDGGNWIARLGSLAVGLALAGTAAALWLRRQAREQTAARRFFETLNRLDPHALRRDTADSEIPPLESGHPLADVARRLRDGLIELAEQFQDLEHARNATEIRCRRATTEYERVKAILTSLDEPIVAIDPFDEVILANPSAKEVLGIDAEQTEDRALRALVRCETLVNLLSTTSRRKAMESRSDEIQVPATTADGGWYRVTARRLAASGAVDEDAPGGGAVAVLRDIGETKALQRRNAEFVSSVSHEMKTPLAGIKAYVELLADGEAEDEQTREEFCGVITAQADRLQRLVENLLNLARMEAGVVKVDKDGRPLNEILEEALGVVRPAAEAKQIELVSDLSPMYLGVFADRDLLLQAAINLLSNAIKYTPNGGRVTLRSRMVDAHVRFEVEDTGVGLSEEDKYRVFEKFYRVKKDKDMAQGTGLGLPLAKHIVEDVHGGTLTVDSVLGKGSTFAVVLPGSGQISS
ncbi:MAG: PAS domain S-box protein [Pirellulales bacterium]|nr:PAS domain S-box protein [Pirellulales bacterium]